jgi:6-phosphofructokinase 1
MDQRKRIAVFTSGGDAQGMNAAVRAVVRTALNRGADVFAIYEGYNGLVEGGDLIRPMTWDSVGGILQLGGTVIGTARSAEFRERSGRLKAARNLLAHGIDRLVVIGGDGSLTGANQFRQEWSGLLTELVADGEVDADVADAHPSLYIVGLVGSIDNDMRGTDMTIGADSALHRITEAIDAINSTAASHQRTFVVEVMGRRCGYLPLRGAIAGAADFLFIPEAPPAPGWEEKMCELLHQGRAMGRRDSIVIVAEGAIDTTGAPIESEYVRKVLEDRLGEDTRVTVLGHVQRGGSPSAFDRYMSTIVGYAAVNELLDAPPDTEPQLIGLRNNRIRHTPLMASVEQTHAVNRCITERDFAKAVELRGGSFRESLAILATLSKVEPGPTRSDAKRFAVLHAGGPAPGMNAAVRVAVRQILDQGHRVVGVRDGFEGLIEGKLVDLDWMSVSGWTARGGAELGVTRRDLSGKDLYAIARAIEEEGIDGILMIGGWSGYVACHHLFEQRANFPAFAIPIVAMPASIDNNLPGSEVSIGADTALNSIVNAVDRIKQSATAAGRCFVVEVMGRYCGYLALLGGLATGAERVYLHEEGVTLRGLVDELEAMREGFARGKRLNLVIRNENANPVYDTAFMTKLFEEEGGELFSVRQAILGHQQQGGDPSPFDRIMAARLATRCVTKMVEEAEAAEPAATFIGISEGHVAFTGFQDFTRLVDLGYQRPKEQFWMGLREVAGVLSHGEDVIAASGEATGTEPPGAGATVA